MRELVLNRFRSPCSLPSDITTYLQQVQDTYVTDAYHSLSIEGYRVTPELIERVRDRIWAPDTNDSDRQQKDALATHGYWLAYQAVRKSLTMVLEGKNAGAAADDDHGEWYRQLFAPSVTAGLLRQSDLADIGIIRSIFDIRLMCRLAKRPYGT